MSVQEGLTGRSKRRKVAKDSTLSKLNKGAPSETKRALYHCNYCQKDISSVARVKCAVCPDFDLCLECFSVGVEIAPHKNNHAYRIVDNLSFPIYRPDWGADEEMLLLEALDMYGLGNWAAVSEHVGGKPAEQCKEHYYQVYIDVDTFPMPSPAPELLALSQEELRAGVVSARAPQPTTMRKRGRQDSQAQLDSKQTPGTRETAADGEEGAAAASSAGEEGGAAHEEADTPLIDSSMTAGAGAKRMRHGTKEHARHGAGGEGGVHEGKHHREEGAAGEAGPPEAEAHAHAAVGRGITGGKGPAAAPGTGSKEPSKPHAGAQADVGGYNPRRVEFDPEWDNDAECTIADMEFSEFDPEEDRQAKLRVLEIYNKRLDERERRRAFLIDYGLITASKVQALEKRRMSHAERELCARLRVFTRYENAPGAQDELVEGFLLEHRLRSRIQELKEYRRNGVRTLADAEIFETERRRTKQADQAALAAAKNASKGRGGAAAAAAEDVGAGSSTQVAPGGLKEAAKLGLPGASTRGAAPALMGWRAKRGVGLDITCLPGVELLGPRERELCASARLLPVHYLALKDMMMRDSQAHGGISRQEARTFFRLDAARCQRMYDLWLSLGWVTGGGKVPPALPLAGPNARAAEGLSKGGTGEEPVRAGHAIATTPGSMDTGGGGLLAQMLLGDGAAAQGGPTSLLTPPQPQNLMPLPLLPTLDATPGAFAGGVTAGAPAGTSGADAGVMLNPEDDVIDAMFA